MDKDIKEIEKALLEAEAGKEEDATDRNGRGSAECVHGSPEA